MDIFTTQLYLLPWFACILAFIFTTKHVIWEPNFINAMSGFAKGIWIGFLSWLFASVIIWLFV